MKAKAKKSVKAPQKVITAKNAKSKVGQKSRSRRAKTPIQAKKKSKQLATDFVPAIDPAHQEGHKRMNLKQDYTKSTGTNKTRSKSLSVLQSVSRADMIRRNESPQRRIPSAGK